MYKLKSRKIMNTLRRQGKRLSKRLTRTIKNKTNKFRNFYKKMLKKFKGGCTSCSLTGG